MKAIGHLLDRFHDVVEPFAEPVGLAVTEEVHDAEAPTIEHLDVLQHLRYFALAGTTLPGTELGALLPRGVKVDDNSEVFLQQVNVAQCLVARN